MGMFDTVVFRCCHCGEKMEIQSKEGLCELKTYPQEAVPPAIAASLTNKIETCESCGENNVIMSSLQGLVPCGTRPVNYDEEVYNGRLES